MGGVAWSEEEDDLLRKCIQQYGEGKWHRIPLFVRCRKSCRLRWLNYLRPNIKRGKFTQEEIELIIKLHNLLDNRWSVIAGRLPERTANDVKNYWHCHLSKRLNCQVPWSSNLPCKKSSTTKENVGIVEINQSCRGSNNNVMIHNNVASKEMVTCVEDNLYEVNNNNNNVIIGQRAEVNDVSSCQENMMSVEELKMDIDFDLEEIKLSGSDHSKFTWDFDHDFLFNMDI